MADDELGSNEAQITALFAMVMDLMALLEEQVLEEQAAERYWRGVRESFDEIAAASPQARDAIAPLAARCRAQFQRYAED